MATFDVEELSAQPTAVVRGSVPIAELPGFFHHAFEAVMASLGAHGLAPVGPPFGCYLSMPGETVELVAGFPVATPVEVDGEVEPFELPGGRAVTALHVGSYDALAATYETVLADVAEAGLALGSLMWESYLSDPAAEPDPATWRTRIVWPLAG